MSAVAIVSWNVEACCLWFPFLQNTWVASRACCARTRATDHITRNWPCRDPQNASICSLVTLETTAGDCLFDSKRFLQNAKSLDVATNNPISKQSQRKKDSNAPRNAFEKQQTTRLSPHWQTPRRPRAPARIAEPGGQRIRRPRAGVPRRWWGRSTGRTCGGCFEKGGQRVQNFERNGYRRGCA